MSPPHWQTAADADYEVDQGVSFVGINALVMRRYMHEFGWKHEDFAPFSINSHANAMHNPYARLHEKITVEKFEKSSMVATPINLLDASPTGDGAAAMIIVPAENVARQPRIIRLGFCCSHGHHCRSFAQRSHVPAGRIFIIKKCL